MPYEYQEVRPGLWARPEVISDLARVDGAIFDVDGVLVDVNASYPMAITGTAQFFFEKILGWPGGEAESGEKGRLLFPGEVAYFKQAGGFNNDWAVAKAGVLFYLWKAAQTGLQRLDELRAAPPSLPAFMARVKERGGGLANMEAIAEPGPHFPAPWDPDLVERLACEHYGGDDWCEEMFGFKPLYRTGLPGVFNDETPLISPPVLAASGLKAGIYTGRVWAETIPALKLVGLYPYVGTLMPETAIITSDKGFRKPNPGGLGASASAMGARVVVYCGDNVDDWVTSRNYRDGREAGQAPGVPGGGPGPELFFAGILGGMLGEAADAIFREKGAELITHDVNLVLQFLAEITGRGRQTL